MRPASAILLACLGLSACQTEQPANPAMAQKLGETCKAYGFKSGTPEFAACIFNLDQQRIANNRQRRMAVGQALSNMGQGMQARRGTNCNSVIYGNVVRTNCY